MRVLYDLINIKALTSWVGSPVSIANYEDWRKHWIDTAKVIQAQFLMEGL